MSIFLFPVSVSSESEYPWIDMFLIQGDRPCEGENQRIVSMHEAWKSQNEILCYEHPV